MNVYWSDDLRVGQPGTVPYRPKYGYTTTGETNDKDQILIFPLQSR